MNLGQLLCAGRTFFGGGGMAEYRLNKRACLPKFNEGKNPFAQKLVEPVPAVAAAPELKKVSVPVAAKTQKISTVPAVTAARRARVGWTTKLNPFRAPEPVAPTMTNAVQPEFSLDTVKVVHNDLADADIEIVPVKSRAAVPVAAPVLSPAREAWEYLGESLLKSS